MDSFTLCKSTTAVYLPPCYKAIERKNGDFGILDLPVEPDPYAFSYDRDKRYMMYQTIHGIPIAGGYASRRLGKSLLDELEMENISEQKAQLSARGIKYIVVHKNLIYNEKDIDFSRYGEFYQLIYDDKDNSVFQVYLSMAPAVSSEEF